MITHSLAVPQAWPLAELVRTVSLLGASADAQREHLQALGTWPSLDELGLEFDDIYPCLPALRSTQVVSDQAAAAVDRVFRLLRVSRGANVQFWDAASLPGSQWEAVREAAQAALRLLPSGTSSH